MPTTFTPLRYPGGKSQLRKFTLELLDSLPHRPSTYIEPFCGGAGIAISLLVKGEVDRIELNDADPGIYSFWHAVINEPDRLINAVNSVKVSVETWEEIRSKYKKFEDSPKGEEFYSFDLAFFTLFLNRTNVSGILDAGCIGGKNQTGKYKIDCRFNKRTLTEKIYSVANRANQISLSGLDAFSFIDRARDSNAASDSLFFLDPPYYTQGKNLYLNFMSHTEHAELAEILRDFRSPWVLTYDNVPEISSLYNWADRRSFSVRYSAKQRRLAQELVIFSEDFVDFQSCSNPTELL